MEPTDRFVALVRRPEASIRLDEAALLIAAHAEPALVVEDELAKLDRLAEGVQPPTLDGLIRALFASGRLRPNRDDYDDPRNSFLHQVLERGIGIPVTLSVVAMEVGRRAGVPLAGVGMPGHFLLRDKVDPSVFVDPFHAGRLLDADGCRRLYRSLAGDGAPWDDAFLDPVDKRSIVARMLANLKGIYARRGDVENLRWVMRLRTRLPAPHTDTVDEFARLMAPLN